MTQTQNKKNKIIEVHFVCDKCNHRQSFVFYQGSKPNMDKCPVCESQKVSVERLLTVRKRRWFWHRIGDYIKLNQLCKKGWVK